jgi:hypothetical protein
MLVDGNIPRCFFGILSFFLWFSFSFSLPGGAELTDEMMKSLATSGYQFSTHAEREIVRDIKEKVRALYFVVCLFYLEVLFRLLVCWRVPVLLFHFFYVFCIIIFPPNV